MNPKICLKRGWIQKISIKKQLGLTKDKLFLTIMPGKVFGWLDEKVSTTSEGIPVFSLPINEGAEIMEEEDSSIKFSFPQIGSEDILIYFTDSVEAREWLHIIQKSQNISQQEISTIVKL